MKIFTITALVILNAATALSQITISAVDAQAMFAVGKSWRTLVVENTNTASMNVGTASASAQSWVFPGGTMTDSVRMDNLLPSATPYANLFKLATHAQKYSFGRDGMLMQVYTFYRITPDSLNDLGNVTRTQINGTDTTFYAIKYRPEITFPWTRGKSTNWRDSSYLGQGAYTLERYVQIADAYGALTLPNGTFQALRLKNVSYTETYAGGFLLASDSIVTIDWVTKEGHTMSVTPTDMRTSSGTIPISTYSYHSIITTPSAVAEGGPRLPGQFDLCQNYPNPFNPTTQIEYSLPQSAHVTLTIYDVLGKTVATLVNDTKGVGTYTATWNAQNSPSGVYFYKLTAGSSTLTRKLLLQR